jgi:streptogramin lyase
MRLDKPGRVLLAGLAALLILPLTAVYAASDTPVAQKAAEAQLPDRTVKISALKVAPSTQAGNEIVGFNVTLTSTGPAGFRVEPADFTLSAEGDIFGQASPPTPAGSLTGSIQSHGARTGSLTFVIPVAALQRAALVYHPVHERVVASIPLTHASMSAQTSIQGPGQGRMYAYAPMAQQFSALDHTANSLAATTSNTIEDDFTRPDQAGWGSSTNSDGVPNVAWGMDGAGSLSYVAINGNSGHYGYQGNANFIGIASAGSAIYNGGDVLARVSLSAVGHGTPYVALNACSNKSCYYGARLHTSTGQFELAKRQNGGTGVYASTVFTPAANTAYWIRLDVNPTTHVLSGKIWQDGSSEPSAWTLQWTDTGTPLGAGYAGAGGSWDHAGNGEYFSYTCFAYAASGSAAPCGGGSSPTPTPTVTTTPTTPTPTPSAGGPNTIEDTFQRPNQAGWGSSTNSDGVPNVAWGMDGSGSLSYVSLNNNTGQYSYPGATNTVGIASAGSTAYNGGDALARFTVSAIGHATPYIVVNACANKSCYYGVRLHTSQNHLELAKRAGGGTAILAAISFTPVANTAYWMRLDVVPGGTSASLQAKIWADGSAEPTSWMVSATDGSPLAANLPGAGGSWDQVGTGESINYSCFAYAASGPASPCSGAGGGAPTPTPTPSITPTPSPTPTPPPPGSITEYQLAGGVGNPWGTAIDAAGNVWFAEPGCDFAPTCSATTPPGQIGMLPAGSSAPTYYTLPNITGNQPIFVALDSAGNVWFTTPNNSMIGEFSPTTKQFVGQWSVTAGSGPWDLTIANGKIWYTEHLVSSIGMFDPSTHSYQDFPTPTASSNPYGIAANGALIWFTENNNNVARIAVLNTNTNVISEYLIRASLQNTSITPHLIALDGKGNPWWTEGWTRAIGTLNVQQATAGTCGATTGDCAGVSEAYLPAPPSTCNSSHTSGIAIQGGGQLVWLTDSLSAQVGSYSPSTGAFTLSNLSCGAHPHDGVSLYGSSQVWWDEEFANALGAMAQ